MKCNPKAGNAAVLVLGALTLFFAVLAGYFYLQTQKVTPATQTPDTKTPTKTDETANWKTYANSKFNYSLRYSPDNWTVKETNYTGTLGSTTFSSTVIPYTDFTITIQQSWEGTGEAQSATRNTTISGIPAYRKTLPGAQNPPQELIFFENNNKVFNIQLVWDGKDQKILSEFDQILSTFKFTDSNYQNSNWQTYVNSKNGFSVKYPQSIASSGPYSGEWGVYENGKIISFGPPSTKSGGYLWSISIATQSDRENLINQIGQQFEDRIVKRENIVLDNGVSALLVTVTTKQTPSWISKTVFISPEASMYVLSNGAVDLPEFTYFYNSFVKDDKFYRQ